MCVSPLSATESISRLFLVILQDFTKPQPFSSSLMSRDEMNAEDLQ